MSTEKRTSPLLPRRHHEPPSRGRVAVLERHSWSARLNDSRAAHLLFLIFLAPLAIIAWGVISLLVLGLWASLLLSGLALVVTGVAALAKVVLMFFLPGTADMIVQGLDAFVSRFDVVGLTQAAGSGLTASILLLLFGAIVLWAAHRVQVLLADLLARGIDTARAAWLGIDRSYI